MTRSFHKPRARPAAVRRSRHPAITPLGFTMFTFEGDWPVVVLSSRNAMATLQSLPAELVPQRDHTREPRRS